MNRNQEKGDSLAEIRRIDTHVDEILAPQLRDATSRLDTLIAKRVELESVRSDIDQVQSLRDMKAEIERASKASRGAKKSGSRCLQQLYATSAPRSRRFSGIGNGRAKGESNLIKSNTTSLLMVKIGSHTARASVRCYALHLPLVYLITAIRMSVHTRICGD